MPVAIRFVDANTVISSGTTANAIKDKLLDLICQMGLDFEELRGQGYDSTSNMSGVIKSVAKQIQDISPQVIFVHCFAHRLNLCVVQSCKIINIKYMMDKVKANTDYFNNSVKRMSALVTNITRMTLEACHKVLLDPSQTRWIKMASTALKNLLKYSC